MASKLSEKKYEIGEKYDGGASNTKVSTILYKWSSNLYMPLQYECNV